MIFYVLRGDVSWRLLPKSTAFRWFSAWRDQGYVRGNELYAGDDGPRACRACGVIDSQSVVKTNESGGPRGYDARKKIMGHKRHALVDTDGRAPELFAHRASVQDRDGGPYVTNAAWVAVKIVRRKPDQVGFAFQPKKWVVERFFTWINRNRRLRKDAEATIASATAFLYAAASLILIRRIARFE